MTGSTRFDQLMASLPRGTTTGLGGAFERVVKWFRENDPEYRLLVRRVWPWDRWPGRWGTDTGIDLVVEDHDGKLWAGLEGPDGPSNAPAKPGRRSSGLWTTCGRRRNIANMVVVRQDRGLPAAFVAGLGAAALAVRRAFLSAVSYFDSDADVIFEDKAAVVATAVALVIYALVVVGALVSVYYLGGLVA